MIGFTCLEKFIAVETLHELRKDNTRKKMVNTKLFDQKSLTAKPSALDRMNYKRLRIMAEESLYLTLKSEFPHQYNDPNTSKTCTDMVVQINILLANLYTKMSNDNV